MSHTNAWDETAPAGTDLISAGDDEIRQFKLDTRERMAANHLWGSSLDHDGKHTKVVLRPEDNTTLVLSETTPSLTGTTAAGMIDLSQTWNTSGVCRALRLIVTNTASAAISTMFDLVVNGSSIFWVSLTGALYERGRTTAIGEWIAYTPSWTNEDGGTPSVGDGTLTGKYMKVGATVWVSVKLHIGSTTTYGTEGGAWVFGLPVVNQGLIMTGLGVLSHGVVWGLGFMLQTLGTFRVSAVTPAMGYLSDQVPFVAATGDEYEFTLMFVESLVLGPY
jgi:hypothetical protein